MTLMKTLLAAALAATLPLGAVAQDFPDDTVTVVIPFTPGGSNDTIGRYLAENLAKHWDSTVVVENKPGAGSRSEEHTSELQSLMRISYAVFCLKNKKIKT